MTDFAYDAENRLVSAIKGSDTVSLRYDPLGRLYEVKDQTGSTVNSVRRMYYAGSDLIAEYDGSGVMQGRYVHGLSAGDDPLVAFEGSNAGLGNSWFLYGDARGSIVMSVKRGGSVGTHVYAYDDYGVPDSGNLTAPGPQVALGRFGYTGQTWVPELGLWHYKARMYSPTLGRFMQTDPIGYADGMNMYAYVGNDPINRVDPTGYCRFNATALWWQPRDHETGAPIGKPYVYEWQFARDPSCFDIGMGSPIGPFAIPTGPEPSGAGSSFSEEIEDDEDFDERICRALRRVPGDNAFGRVLAGGGLGFIFQGSSQLMIEDNGRISYTLDIEGGAGLGLRLALPSGGINGDVLSDGVVKSSGMIFEVDFVGSLTSLVRGKGVAEAGAKFGAIFGYSERRRQTWTLMNLGCGNE